VREDSDRVTCSICGDDFPRSTEDLCKCWRCRSVRCGWCRDSVDYVIGNFALRHKVPRRREAVLATRSKI
jgi:hypothetical protein